MGSNNYSGMGNNIMGSTNYRGKVNNIVFSNNYRGKINNHTGVEQVPWQGK